MAEFKGFSIPNTKYDLPLIDFDVTIPEDAQDACCDKTNPEDCIPDCYMCLFCNTEYNAELDIDSTDAFTEYINTLKQANNE